MSRESDFEMTVKELDDIRQAIKTLEYAAVAITDNNFLNPLLSYELSYDMSGEEEEKVNMAHKAVRRYVYGTLDSETLKESLFNARWV